MTRYKIVIIFLLLIFTLTSCDSQEQTIYNNELDFLKTASTGTTVVFHFPDFPHRSDYEPVFKEISSRAKRALGINLEFKRPEEFVRYGISYEISMMQFKKNRRFDAAVIYTDFAELVEDDEIMDITELFPENAQELYSKFTKEELEQVSIDGRIYAIPPNTTASERLCAVVREDLVEKYKLEGMSTLDEYAEFLKTLKESSSTNEISRMLYYDMPLLLQKHDLVWLEGYMVYKKSDENMRLQAWEQTSEFSDLYDTLRKMIDSGFIWDYMPGTPACYRERLASILTDWDKARICVRLLAPIANYRIFPLYPEKKAPAKQLNNPVIVISSQSLHPDLAIKVINWIHNDQEIYDLFMYGLKGSDYDLVDNKVKLNGERWPFYGWRAARAFMDDDMEREFVTDPPGFNTQYELELENGIEYNPIARFKPKYDSFTRSDVSRRTNAIAFTTRTSLINYREKTRGLKYVTKLVDDVRTNRIIEATQQQLDAWRKRQKLSAENNKTDK